MSAKNIDIAVIANICKRNIITNHLFVVPVTICKQRVYLAIEYSHIRRGYLARPMMIGESDRFYPVRIQIHPYQFHEFKRKLRMRFRIRHIEGINGPENEQRVKELLGMTKL